ncbi:uncharacterized protein TOT_040000301 [Theileria orientalis strain Shintoku]|uniref:Sphingomyelin synthase-like domain-containing protein n=1 Tax=Theileria orientalis strain Shintoku TaxID=869250 RepID=J4C4C0_THEOR|nr:uncharacterized protein TOT_040000301 [Theileria orientalis strain Shintoku]PVC51335.1 hypothetical protein MACL_00001617 [Theileria orientalis]BAM41921.1 uncharacterized protein TOT_040000301 [Theileria orientalis strain Shintoku]|eukprot:XP_009692222.1 uncharacterized protein TOT_040000301 [Theileria orientalis strain Shintoku]
MDPLNNSEGNANSQGEYSSSDSDLVLEIDYNLPFVVGEDTSVEYEVKSAINQFRQMLGMYLFRVVMILILLTLVLFFQGILMFLSDKHYMKTRRIPLPDRIHEIVDRFNHPFSPALCDATMFIFVFAGILRVVMFTPLFYTLQMILRYVTLFGSGYFIRGFFVYVTTMPSCYRNCTPDLTNRGFFQFFIRILAGYMGIVTNCTDLIISGHTMFTVITCVLLCENLRFLASKIVCCLYTVMVLFFIVACKYHYTVDVLFGLLLSVLMYYFYYSKIDDYGINLYNKIYHSRSKAVQDSRVTSTHDSYLTALLASFEMLEERMVLGQKMRTLYLLVNSEKNLIDKNLLRKFNRYVHLFGADESEDITTLYRGTKRFNFYYWKSLYRIIFRRKKIITI